MTGSPLLRLVLVWVGLLLTTFVGWRLTVRTDVPPPASPPLPPNPTAHPIDFTFTGAPEPTEIQIEVSGSHVATLHPNHKPVTTSLPLAVPAEGRDLVISATWPPSPGSPARALRIQATQNAQPLVDTTLWGESSIRDVVTLPPPSRP